MQNELNIIITLAFIIFASPYISRMFRISIAPVEIMLGSVAGFMGIIVPNETFWLISNVGFLFLMFLAGMEIDLRLVLSADKKLLKNGFIYLAILYFLASAVTFGFDLDRLFVIIIPIMSVGMIFTLFKEYGKEETWLNASMLVGCLGELFSIVFLTFASSYMQFGNHSGFWISIAYLLGFMGLSVLIYKLFVVLFWWYPSLKTIIMPYYDKNEKDIRLSIALFLVMIALMIHLHLEIVFGVFIAGMFVTTFFGHKKDLPHKLGSFGFGFLVPIFFVYIGTTLKLDMLLNKDVLNYAFLITIMIFLCRFVSSFVFLRMFGFKKMLLFALSQSMPLTLLVAVATIAHSYGDMSEQAYSSFILASLLQAVIMMISIKIINNYKKGGRYEKYSNSH
ncbi:hypothetical protein LMG7974_01716 [Campylobacter majalis]|uniref:Cation/H+ exchanger transmembrane domain-containing protein n=1 Tax=Campylobacter majalis TaxID=2790656 RepID=A0ABM8Q9V0_9BACT|nr:cation:proton antiporter [Campylobacter majalis]CAD7289639.1 hypothetical protein LMG7974_01716 [Campylobacter majalis]